MATSRNSAGILVIDDDEMSREVLGVLLEGQGYTVETAESGDAALSLVGNGAAPPKIILSDMQMPGLTGTPLAVGLREACGEETLLVAMSGSRPAPKVLEGFDEFLLKPFTMAEFEATVTAIRHGGSIQGSAADRVEVDGSDIDVPALDQKIYQQLAVSMQKDQLHQLYALCLKDARERVVRMGTLAMQGDSAAFIRDAHSIKGGCGMLGATELYRLAASLESRGLQASGLQTAGSTGTPGNDPLENLAAACDRLESILGALAVHG